ncbi:MAG TPA: integration host factor [Actinobacteria bacterium]|jgi:DNA-binding protein HU-beta|nr:integration host factor [Actinomycetota bacterium]
MNRSELIAAAATRTGLTADQVEQALHGIQSAITEAISAGERVSLTGFLTLEVVQRSAREGRNPKTGESLTIPARKAVKVSAGQALKRAAADS